MRRGRNCCFADPRPHKLQATLRSAYVRLSQSRGAKLALLEPHAIPRPAASGRSRPFRCSSSPNCKRFAGLQFGSVCLARKSGQKEALDADRIVPQATEQARRRTLRPAHGNPSTNLNYSAACVETTLPSETVATQGDGKTHCRGMQNASTCSPVVQHICKGGHGRLLCLFFIYVCRGRCPHRPLQTHKQYRNQKP